MTTPSLTIQRHTPAQAKEITEELIRVYATVYDVPPYTGDPFFSVDTYASRLHAAFDMEGFEVVTAHLDHDAIAGYVHGVTLPAEREWWTSLGDRRPPAASAAAPAGQVFWLREIMVLPDHTNQGIGRRLHDAMVTGRHEPWTALTCITDNEPARSAYPRWGYQVIGQIRHAPESPLYDAMVLPPSPAA
ncbi:GNAT family N-acetyltransferase [Streptacidiphilus sp. EB129]|uniref:GNAT family N-acetyltransferase n=1 Tax=Streptacidiphilus sp. EB129 TaxID=3156262 RepID=UPI003518B869